ncbi:hypothetical protein VIGAN_04026400 [Vigna angularis var. angularis]|uniref:Uncharacterized protein n=1 Tax=Vigna angularis var. angularis TaxID=157739 RepID=A0A0S3RRF9_PHAAN|nr:hypothetical protein VIGAN_04026400 [Vigna angularis var. angularis]
MKGHHLRTHTTASPSRRQLSRPPSRQSPAVTSSSRSPFSRARFSLRAVSLPSERARPSRVAADATKPGPPPSVELVAGHGIKLPFFSSPYAREG